MKKIQKMPVCLTQENGFGSAQQLRTLSTVAGKRLRSVVHMQKKERV
jgi:hypothetical protein